MSHPFTDIVLPIHNALSYLRTCVETICNYTENYRIIFVDDYSDKETKEYLQRCMGDHKDWLLVQTGKQKWFTRSSNLGLRLAKTERVVLINSDCGVGPGWLQELYDVWDEAKKTNANIGLVGSIVYDASPSVRFKFTNGVTGDYVTGHCYLLSLAVLEDLARKRGTPGWYFNEKDPGQIHIASDRILCWDLNKAGYGTVGCYMANVGHHGGKSWGYNLGSIPTTVQAVD